MLFYFVSNFAVDCCNVFLLLLICVLLVVLVLLLIVLCFVTGG